MTPTGGAPGRPRTRSGRGPPGSVGPYERQPATAQGILEHICTAYARRRRGEYFTSIHVPERGAHMSTSSRLATALTSIPPAFLARAVRPSSLVLRSARSDRVIAASPSPRRVHPTPGVTWCPMVAAADRRANTCSGRCRGPGPAIAPALGDRSTTTSTRGTTHRDLVRNESRNCTEVGHGVRPITGRPRRSRVARQSQRFLASTRTFLTESAPGRVSEDGIAHARLLQEERQRT